MEEPEFPTLPYSLKQKLRNMGYIRHCILSVEQVMPFLLSKTPMIINDDIIVRTSSTRIQTYTLGIRCTGEHGCNKVRINYFAVERQHSEMSAWHLNAYGIHADTGAEVMMTSDHIHPVNRGGPDGLSNRQPLCEACNNKKSDLLPGEEKSPRMLAGYQPKKVGTKHTNKATKLIHTKRFYVEDSRQIRGMKVQVILAVQDLAAALKAADMKEAQRQQIIARCLKARAFARHTESDWGMTTTEIIDMITSVRALTPEEKTPAG